MKNFIKNVLTDSNGNYSSRLISGWVALFVLIVLLFCGYSEEAINPLLIYIGSCFSLSVIGEVANKESAQLQSKEDLED